MFEIKWIHELILVIYGVSVMGYFIEFVQHNRKAQKWAFWLLRMVWILQTVFLLFQMVKETGFPILSIYDGLFFYSWVLVTFSLLISRFFKVIFFIFITNLLGFFILLLSITSKAETVGGEQGVRLVGELLITHITLALVSYGFFTLSFVFSIMYLLQYRLLKVKKGYKWLKRLGDLERLDRLSFQTITIGVPALLISMVMGIVWAYSSGAEFYWNDIKTIGSIIVLFVYTIYLFLRLGKGYQGRAISMFNTGAFLFLLINFFLFSTLSNFHF